jgi:hypothetical protein
MGSYEMSKILKAKWCIIFINFTDFLIGGTSYSKKNPTQIKFIKDLVLLHVYKRYENILIELSLFENEKRSKH